LLYKKTSSLVCIRGRRRIGKSTLVKYFSKRFVHYIEIQGLAPTKTSSNDDQLKNFSNTLSSISKLPLRHFTDWAEAFGALNQLISNKKTLIFLDEISWMGKYDPQFPGKLKIAWDTLFKHHPNLIIILCGSVSSWIKDNILNNTGFVGRLSLNIKLEELSLQESMELLKINPNKVSSYEIAKILSLTGGVPKYLEEINIKNSIEKNIEDLALNQNGILFTEFEQIFADIFDKKHPLYKSILLEIIKGHKNPTEIAVAISHPYNGDFAQYLDTLVESGFLSRDFTWAIRDYKQSKLAQLRISDNFLRFYLKIIWPLKPRIQKLPLKISSIKNWESLLGLQFENLIHKNYLHLLTHLQISPSDVLQIGPYFQNKTTKQEGVQIDLLIQTKLNLLYNVEIKIRRRLDTDVIRECQRKNKAINKGKNFSLRNILVYCGELSSSLEESDFFDKMISFDELLSDT